MSDGLDLKVIEGITLSGQSNTSDAAIRENIASAIRRQHPQAKRQAPNGDRVALVGSGPSLLKTMDELMACLRDGAKLATVNGAYQWAIEQHLTPSVQIVLDARASNARFVDPYLPTCNYLIASTCHPDLWDKMADREKVWIYHPLTDDPEVKAMLDAYYLGAWDPIGGSTSVASRGLYALAHLGYKRFDLFGIDCSWDGTAHHAFPQPENAHDKRYGITVAPTGHPELGRRFYASGWMLKQYEDFLQIVRHANHFLLNVHGDGLLAWTLRVNADLADIEVAPVEGV